MRARMAVGLIAVMVVLAVVGCAGKRMARLDMREERVAKRTAPGGAYRAEKAASVDEATVRSASYERMALPWSPRQKIIRTATISMETEDVRGALQDATQIARTMGGYLFTSRASGDEEHMTAQCTLRVPTERFEDAMTRLRELGRIKEEDVSSDDVTQEYVDLQSRTRNLKQEETLLLEIMNKTRKVPEILQVERELVRVRGQIEQVQGRINYLEHATDYCTITLYLTQTKRPEVVTAGLWNLADTWRAAGGATMQALAALARGGIWLLVTIPLWGIPLAIIYVGIRRVMR